MKHSELWRAVESVYGSAYGRSLVKDLVLTGLGTTAQEALDAGTSPRRVWDALCDETDASQADRWVYREDGRRRG
ncbi:DUF3046 domain-containing protein [Actinomyces sp. W5033]|uniref:DUF3046 domain-containing protein n=1 Tax=Actinomyces sp. W5033 TaxID=3446479 RepID=UPI003EDF88C4